VLVVLVLACVSAGCGETRHSTQPKRAAGRVPAHVPRDAPRPAEAELQWIGRLDSWYADQFYNGDGADCASSFARAVGPPPTKRLRVFSSTVSSACAIYAAAQGNEERGLRTKDGTLLDQSTAQYARGEAVVARLKRELKAYRPDINENLPVVAGVALVSRTDPRLSRIATSFAKRNVPMQIRCWSRDEWDTLSTAMNVGAFTHGTLNKADFSADDCNALERLLQSERVPRSLDARERLQYSLFIFTHELEHLSGTSRESSAECFAMQDVEKVARRLGAPPAFAARIGPFFWRVVYPIDDPDYRSADCRNNGLLDLHPGRKAWP
jgi:hypothetical protein